MCVCVCVCVCGRYRGPWPGCAYRKAPRAGNIKLVLCTVGGEDDCVGDRAMVGLQVLVCVRGCVCVCGWVGTDNMFMYIRIYVYTYKRSYVCMYIRMYIDTYVCMYLHTYVCTYYVHTCYVLTNPPIQSSPCNHIVILRPIFYYIAREPTQGSPIVTTFKVIFFLFFHLFTWDFFTKIIHAITWGKSRELIPCKRLKDM